MGNTFKNKEANTLLYFLHDKDKLIFFPHVALKKRFAQLLLNSLVNHLLMTDSAVKSNFSKMVPFCGTSKCKESHVDSPKACSGRRRENQGR